MALLLEFSVNRVDTATNTSSTIAILRFDENDLTKPPEVLNPPDARTLAILKGYILREEASVAAIAATFEAGTPVG